MRKYILFCMVIMLFTTAKAGAQEGYNERAKKYIDQYYPLAIAEQRISGIPASITLGQGILETEAGASELMTIANNHFGIKCNNGWQGPTFTHTDDAPDECFKKYSCAAESYRDHSLHLKRNPRYAHLFTLSTTDYASWAVCLKKCGYATNPLYAQKLIKIIEDFKLQEYTYSALDSTNSGNYPVIPASAKKTDAAVLLVKSGKVEATPLQAEQDDISDTDKIADNGSSANTASGYDNSKVIKINGMDAFYAGKGEMLLKYADEYHIKYSRLLEMNDLQDAPLPFSMYVYLEKKPAYGTHARHTVLYGETLFMISQTEGIQFKKLMALNLLNPNEEPLTGSILELQRTATEKPEVKVNEIKAHKGNAIVMAANSDPTPNSDYISTGKSKAEAATAAKQVAAATDHGDDYETDEIEPTTAKRPKTKPEPAAKPTTAAPDRGDGYVTNWDETTPVPAKPAVAKVRSEHVAKPTTAASDRGDDYVTNWDEATPIPAKPSVAKIKPEPAAKPITAAADHGDGYVANWDETTPVPAKRAGAAAKHEPNTIETTKAAHEANPGAANDDDLASLKADLDKVVYADDSKLPAGKAKTQQTPVKKEQLPDQKKTVDSHGAKYYTIKKGETAFSIAKKNDITVEELLKLNHINAGGIKAGRKILVK